MPFICMVIITKAGLVRLAVLFIALGGALLAAWFVMIRMPGKSYSGAASPLSPAERALRDELRRDVDDLAGKIGERNSERPKQLAVAADFIAASFGSAGCRVARLPYTAGSQTFENIEARTRDAGTSGKVVVVGAHYDSVLGSQGANDNASGVAALLALARRLAGRTPPLPVRFVAFANEEPPHFQHDAMGSLVYAHSCRERGDDIAAMLSLETMGCYDDEEGSQHYPPPLSGLYPSRGNFIGFVGNVASRALVRRAIATFRAHTAFPSEGAALPEGIPGVGWSDHWSFWQAGYRAIMITDTAPFRYPHYHTALDTPEHVDCDRLARVVAGLESVIEDLAGKPD